MARRATLFVCSGYVLLGIYSLLVDNEYHGYKYLAQTL